MVEILKATNRMKEPKSMKAGIWRENGDVKWMNESGNKRIPDEMKREINFLLWRKPEDIDTKGLGQDERRHKYKDILEVKFSGKDGKLDEIVILEQDVYRRSRGKVEVRRAKPTWKQIQDLIAERGEQPREVYWERDLFVGDTHEHIEATIPYSDIELQIRDIAKDEGTLKMSQEKIAEKWKGAVRLVSVEGEK